MPVTPVQLKRKVLQIFVNRVEVANHSSRVRCPSRSPAQMLQAWFHPVLLELVAKKQPLLVDKGEGKGP